MPAKKEILEVDVKLLHELVSASSRTALTHRGDQHEEYVLGQLEATANIVYVLSVETGNTELESLCQKHATEAIQRLEEINPALTSDGDLQSDILA